jgi:hypothetical protein
MSPIVLTSLCRVKKHLVSEDFKLAANLLGRKHEFLGFHESPADPRQNLRRGMKQSRKTLQTPSLSNPSDIKKPQQSPQI